jgi:hypothetical protein
VITFLVHKDDRIVHQETVDCTCLTEADFANRYFGSHEFAKSGYSITMAGAEVPEVQNPVELPVAVPEEPKAKAKK